MSIRYRMSWDECDVGEYVFHLPADAEKQVQSRKNPPKSAFIAKTKSGRSFYFTSKPKISDPEIQVYEFRRVTLYGNMGNEKITIWRRVK